MKAVVNVTVANLHAQPNHMSELVDEALFGMPVTITEQIDEQWVKVQIFYRYEGYCLKANLYERDQWLDKAKYVVKQSFADVLVEPKIQSGKIITLTRGAFIAVEVEKNIEAGWTRVTLPNGEAGYVRTNWLAKRIETMPDEESFREQVVEAAFAYLGTPYRWGGKSLLGIDGSGLCQMAYMLNGVLIYRDAKILDGFPLKEIDKNALKKGDLIFFPGHVAMYIGNDEYIHSSLSGNEVNVNSLNEKATNYRHDLATTITSYGSLF